LAKKKNNQPALQLNTFIAVVIALTVYFLTIVWVKNDCMVTGKYVDQIQRELTSLKNDRKLLRSKLSNLTSNSRVSKLAAERFGMTQPQPEPVIIVRDRTR